MTNLATRAPSMALSFFIHAASIVIFIAVTFTAFVSLLYAQAFIWYLVASVLMAGFIAFYFSRAWRIPFRYVIAFAVGIVVESWFLAMSITNKSLEGFGWALSLALGVSFLLLLHGFLQETRRA